MADAFSCSLVTPEKAVFEVDAKSVVIPSHDGQMGILTHRAPLLTKLGYGKMTVEQSDGGSTAYFIAGGFAQMQDNKLSILTDEAIPTSELSTQTAQADLDEALALPANTPAEQTIKQKKIDRARGLVAVASA